MNDAMKMEGHFLIEARDAQTNELLWQKSYKNMLTNINREIRSNMLRGTYTRGNTALQIKYIALGTGTTAPSLSQTQLVSESYRQYLTQSTLVSTGVVRTTWSIGASNANFHIYEIGVFCGDSATSSADTGNMISRVLVDIDKNSNMVLNVIRTDTCLLNV